jgi:hypothetical protein
MKKNLMRIFLILLFVSSLAATKAGDFDPLPKVQAKSILGSDSFQSANYQIKDPVLTDGYSYEFTIDSTFGTFTALSQTELQIRLHEIDAIAQLKEITGSEAFAQAAGKAAMHSFEATANVVKNPVETAKGIPGGVKRKFENIGRLVKRGSKDDEPEKEEAEKQETEKDSSAASDITKQVLGVTSAQRRWAEKVEVDPYSSNVVLQQELQRLAKYDATGKLGTNIVRPKVQPFQATRRVNDLVWGTDPQALMKMNEQRMKSIGADEELSNRFLNHKVLTPTDHTYILSSLDQLKQAEGRVELIRSALSSESEDDAFFYRDTASILERMQSKGTSITSFLPNPKIAVVRSGKRFIAVLPADKLYWTQSFSAALETFTKRHKEILQNSGSKEIWLSGIASEQARSQLAQRRWIIQENLLRNTDTNK